VDAVLEKLGYGLVDVGQVVRVDAIAPEGWIFQVLRWRIAKHGSDIVADKGGSEIAARFEAVDHRR
jgi:hypothetical protein